MRALVSLGSNLGDSRQILSAAVSDIEAVSGVRVIAVSSLWRTAPVGVAGQPDYLNAVAQVDCDLGPMQLLKALQAIELAHGRVRTERWGARTLDLDIVDTDTGPVQQPELELPHPRAHERGFVLLPANEIAGDWELSGVAISARAKQVDPSELALVEQEWWK